VGFAGKRQATKHFNLKQFFRENTVFNILLLLKTKYEKRATALFCPTINFFLLSDNRDF
jgi:hypothetical protein